MTWTGRRLHFIGIGGAGMSGLALVAARLGAGVTGSDRVESSYTERLTAGGIDVRIGHDAANLDAAAEVVMSTAVGDDNPELARARELGLSVIHRGALLAELAALKRCIAVAGTHGKTTTAAMIAHVLTETGRSPAWVIGGEVAIGGQTANASWGEGEWVVVEADESDRSFLALDPEVAVVTNVELDHHSTYRDLDDLMAAFAEFCARADSVALWRDQPALERLGAGRRTIGFGVAAGEGRVPGPARNGDVVARALVDSATGAAFELTSEDRIIQVKLGVRGAHNVQNALAAIAALELAGVPLEESATQLASFAGVGRRFELIGDTASGAVVYDDYAHHPTEVAAALRTARGAAAGGRVVAVFQPHLYSRTASLHRGFGRALGLADVVAVLDVYPAREQATDFPGVNGYLVAADAADAAGGRPVYWTPDRELALRLLREQLRAGDLCITIGAGDVFELGRTLVNGGSR